MPNQKLKNFSLKIKAKLKLIWKSLKNSKIIIENCTVTNLLLRKWSYLHWSVFGGHKIWSLVRKDVLCGTGCHASIAHPNEISSSFSNTNSTEERFRQNLNNIRCKKYSSFRSQIVDSLMSESFKEETMFKNNTWHSSSSFWHHFT